MTGTSQDSRPYSTEPYSSLPRGVVTGTLSESLFYSFNLADPSGVTLLSSRGRDRLNYLLARGGQFPCEQAEDVDEHLVRAGLLPSTRCGAQPSNSTQEGRTLSVWLQVVHGCNFSCHYCYVPRLGKNIDPGVIESKSMGIADFYQLFDQLVEYCQTTGTDELHLKFAGGEPTLNLGRIRQFCAIASGTRRQSIKISFGMISNGSFDLGELLPLLEEYDISLSLSVDGVSSSHDQIRFERDGRRKIGSWATVARNIEGLVSAARPPYLLYTITPSNYRNIPEFSTFAHALRLGYRLSLVRSPRKVPESVKDSILSVLTEHYVKLGHELSPAMPIPRFARFAEWNLKKKKTIACSTCRNYFAIDQNAQVASCQMTLDKPFGSLKTDALTEIVERVRSAPETRLLAIPSLGDGACSRCRFFHVCAGGCPQHTLASYGDLQVPSPWCRVFGGLIFVYVESVASQMARRLAERAEGRIPG